MGNIKQTQLLAKPDKNLRLFDFVVSRQRLIAFHRRAGGVFRAANGSAFFAQNCHP